MAAILIVGDTPCVRAWASALQRDGHAVEICAHSLDVHERFSSAPVDIFIADVTHADWGEAMLIPQTRATWPECRIIPVASSYAFRSSAVFQMGLWTPDQLLMKPVNPRVLSATVALLWAEIRTLEIRDIITSVPSLRSGKTGKSPADTGADGDGAPAGRAPEAGRA